MRTRAAVCAGVGLLVSLVCSASASAAIRIGGDLSVPEGSSGSWTARFTISDDTPSALRRCIQWGALPDTAFAILGGGPGVTDFGVASGYFCLEPGITSQVVDVVIYGDTDPELDESFTVQVTFASAYDPTLPAYPPVTSPYPIADGVADVKLLDDDTPPPRPRDPDRGPPECTIAYMKKRYGKHPFFDGGSQFFGLMRLAARGMGPGGITRLLQGRAKLRNVLTCPKGSLTGRVELPRKGRAPLLLAAGRLELDFKGAGRVSLRLRTTAAGRAALRGKARVSSRVTIRHVDTQGTAAQRRYRVTLTR